MEKNEFNGGITIRNKAGEPIMWFKGKDPEPGEDGFSFGLFGLWPERAEASELPHLQESLEKVKKDWLALGLPVFDIDEIQTKIKELVGSVRGHFVRGECQVWVTDIVTGKEYTISVYIRNRGLETRVFGFTHLRHQAPFLTESPGRYKMTKIDEKEVGK